MSKKLIEVALPLDDVNAAGAREKSVRHGHPSTLHLWWSRKPLAVARTVIFSQMVDDPSGYVEELRADSAAVEAAWRERVRRGEAGGEPDSAAAAAPESLDGMLVELERERLFGIIRELVKWENTANEAVLERARGEIRRSWRRTCARNAGHPHAGELFNPERLPAFHDPFAGGGALPLEAQRLGLEAHASDLNPVAVLINKAMIEIPPKFAGRPPANPAADAGDDYGGGRWRGAMGLAADVRHYGKWMRDEAERRVGHLYPKVEVTPAMVAERPDLKQYQGRKLTVIAWLWARTVRSPNPAFADVDVPLTSTWMLSTKKGKEAYVEPVVEGRQYQFRIKVGVPANGEAAKLGTSAGKRKAFRCLLSGVPIPYDHIRSEGKAGRMGSRLMAIVAEGDRGRVYLDPANTHEGTARTARPTWKPDCEMPKKHRNFQGPVYGLDNLGDLFTDRQLVALTTFSDLVGEAIERIREDATRAGMSSDPRPLRDGGTGGAAYAEAVALYLGMCVSRQANRSSSISFWNSGGAKVEQVFARQAIPMIWDFCEGNPFSSSSGNFIGQLDYLANATSSFSCASFGLAAQLDARKQEFAKNVVISTDPPYYDNIGYSDLSDFFYIWLRRGLGAVFPELFSTVAAPKTDELIASSYRHGSKEAAELFFVEGMTDTLCLLAKHSHPNSIVTIYYAFKQSEKSKDSSQVRSTGWETFLDAVIRSGFAVTGTWPMRTELTRALKKNIAALASSIVLVCRRRPADAPTVSRREFVSALKSELPPAIADLQRGNIAPVDLAQAAIGPGMSAYTRHALLFGFCCWLSLFLLSGFQQSRPHGWRTIPGHNARKPK